MLLQVLALVGDQLDFGDNICGAVLSIRFNEDILSVWNRNASDHQVSNTIVYCYPPHLGSLHSHKLIYCTIFTLPGGDGSARFNQKALKAPTWICNGIQTSRRVSA